MTKIKNHKNSIIANVFKNMFIVQLMTSFIGIAGSVVDGMVTGKFLGVEAMAAFGFTNCITLTVTIAGSILSTGASVTCSKSLGQGDMERTRHIFSAGFTTVLAVSLILAGIIIAVAVPVVKLTGAQGELISLAADYCRGYGIACPGIMMVAFLMPVMQMDGQMKRVLIAVITMTIGNIAVDFANVLVFHGGMFGMAIATAVSYYMALLVMLPHFRKKDVIFTRPSIRFDRHVATKMLLGGFPSATSQLGRMLLTFILNWFLMFLGGAAAVAAHAVILSAGNLCLVPGTALSAATQVMTGVLYGEEDREGLTKLMRTAIRYNIFVNGAVMLTFFAAAGPMVSLFYQGDPDAIGMTITGFRFYTLCMVFYGINVCLRSFCLASGQTRKAYTIAVANCFICPLIFSLLLGSIFGIPALWMCFVMSECLVTAVMMLLSRRGNAGGNGIERFIPFPASLGEDIEASMACSISENDMERAAELAREVFVFCEKNGTDRRTAHLMSLVTEEAVGNVIEHGFCDGKPHSIDLRVFRKADGWVLRMRDDCSLFNMNKYMEQYAGDDPTTNIGLKMIRGAANDITYLNALKLNNLIIKI